MKCVYLAIVLLIVVVSVQSGRPKKARRRKYEVVDEPLCPAKSTFDQCQCENGEKGCYDCNRCQCHGGRWLCTMMACPTPAPHENWRWALTKHRRRELYSCRKVRASRINSDV